MTECLLCENNEIAFPSGTGVSGATIKFDKFGDSEGNFSVLALKKDPFRFNNFSCDFQMKPVGQFQQGETLVSELFTAFLQQHFISMFTALHNKFLQIRVSPVKKNANLLDRD